MRVRPFSGSSLPRTVVSGPTRNGTTDTPSTSPSDSRRNQRSSRAPRDRGDRQVCTRGQADAQRCERRAGTRLHHGDQAQSAQSMAPQTGWTRRRSVMIRKKIVANTAAAPKLFLCVMMPRHPMRHAIADGCGEYQGHGDTGHDQQDERPVQNAHDPPRWTGVADEHAEYRRAEQRNRFLEAERWGQ